MNVLTQRHEKITTRSANGQINGYLIPIYNVHDGFVPPGLEPAQVYVTIISAGQRKGPHLHKIRTGCFTCIKGDIRIVLKHSVGYEEIHSGENHDYLSVIIPVGVGALIINVGASEAIVLNTPSPAWTPTMNDEHTADFSDYAG